jgi:hypothetical protein
MFGIAMRGTLAPLCEVLEKPPPDYLEEMVQCESL